MRIAFVGGGNMASALIGGLLERGTAATDVSVCDIVAQTRASVATRYQVAVHESVEDTVRGTDTIVLAVKPQQLREVAEQLRPHLGGALVISIAAGIRLTDLSRWLGGHRLLVRAMPNTPALIGAGVTGLYAMPEVAPEQRDAAQNLLESAGTTTWFDHERMLDAVTAISGSGPAYVFYFIEALEQAARELGFEESAARRFSIETFYGAARLARESDESPALLRERVTSKGGTTERALKELEASTVKARIISAVHGADERSRELGDLLGRE